MKRSIGAAAGAFLLALALVPSPAFPVLYIDINAPGGKRMPIAVADVVVGSGDPSLSRGIPKILSDDLVLTDLFDMVPPTAHIETVTAAHFSGKPLSFPGWKMIGAEAVVIGLAEERGNQLSIEMRLYDATQGTLLVAKRYTGTPAQLRSIVHRFANEIVYTFTGVRGVFGTEIAFTARSGKSRGKELYIVGMDGQDLRKVTDNRSFNLFPRWSPDGQWLAYTSFRTGTPIVYLRNVATGAEKEVVRFGGSKAPGGFSPDGVWLYAGVSQSGNSDIYRVRVVGGAVEKVVEGWGLEVSPSPSPDGRRIAFVSDRGGSPQIYVKTIGVSGETRISNGASYATSPSWSPAGDRIAYTARAGGRFIVETVAPDGSGLREVASTTDGNCEDPSFSPDGRSLVYTYRKRDYSALKIISSDGRRQRTLVSGLGDVGSPAWSPGR
ncbi:MAG: Tol-Pal system beta propeller repeat protein TolB [Candidatus Deferrimicrobium sp.]